jgi:hypothetical protein
VPSLAARPSPALPPEARPSTAPESATTGRRRILLGAALVVLLAAAVSLVAIRVGRDDTSNTGTATAADDTGGSAGGWMSDEVSELAGFVEDARGLDFDEPVPVEFLSEDDYDSAAVGSAATDVVDDDAPVALLRALGLAEGDLEPAGSGSTGLYDPSRHRILVRGDRTTSTSSSERPWCTG